MLWTFGFESLPISCTVKIDIYNMLQKQQLYVQQMSLTDATTVNKIHFEQILVLLSPIPYALVRRFNKMISLSSRQCAAKTSTLFAISVKYCFRLSVSSRISSTCTRTFSSLEREDAIEVSALITSGDFIWTFGSMLRPDRARLISFSTSLFP